MIWSWADFICELSVHLLLELSPYPHTRAFFCEIILMWIDSVAAHLSHIGVVGVVVVERPPPPPPTNLNPAQSTVNQTLLMMWSVMWSSSTLISALVCLTFYFTRTCQERSCCSQKICFWLHLSFLCICNLIDQCWQCWNGGVQWCVDVHLFSMVRNHNVTPTDLAPAESTTTIDTAKELCKNVCMCSSCSFCACYIPIKSRGKTKKNRALGSVRLNGTSESTPNQKPLQRWMLSDCGARIHVKEMSICSSCLYREHNGVEGSGPGHSERVLRFRIAVVWLVVVLHKCILMGVTTLRSRCIDTNSDVIAARFRKCINNNRGCDFGVTKASLCRKQTCTH